MFLSEEELDNRKGGEQFVELDSLDTEKALLLTDDDDHLWVHHIIIRNKAMELTMSRIILLVVLLNIMIFDLIFKVKFVLRPTET